MLAYRAPPLSNHLPTYTLMQTRSYNGEFNGLFQKVKIHPHRRRLINLDSFLAKMSLFPDGLATKFNGFLMGHKADLIASRW